MALDHYVSQVHLKNFSHTRPPDRLYAIRKRDGMQFQPRTKTVCRVDEGNTNSYLTDQRAIERFLKTIEPKYNQSIKKLRENQIDAEAIYTIAGFTAYVLSC
jgi:Protein of unknown function (DUF4238)